MSLEWVSTKCSIVTPESLPGYETGDWEPCSLCDDDDCVAYVRLSGDTSAVPPRDTAVRGHGWRERARVEHELRRLRRIGHADVGTEIDAVCARLFAIRTSHRAQAACVTLLLHVVREQCARIADRHAGNRGASVPMARDIAEAIRLMPLGAAGKCP